MRRNIFLLTTLLCIASPVFANNQTAKADDITTDIAGVWKTIDDKTGFSRGDVLITKNANGTYSGKIIAIRPLPDKPLVSVCLKCKGSLQNAPFVGLQVIENFTQNPQKPNEFINGSMLDPLSGNVYKGRARLSTNGKRLTLRGYIGVSMLGRNQTWVRASD